MRILPAIDLIDGKCVRLTQGDYAQKKIYNESPAAVAKEFEDAGLTYLHLVDLDGAKAGNVINWKVVEDITSTTKLRVDFGGGIKTEEEIRRLFDLGVQQVNIGSIAVKQPEKVYEWIRTFGPEKIILSADVKGESIAISGWQENSNINVVDFIGQYVAQGICYVTCTDIGVDGMLSGPNIGLYKKILQKFPMLKLVASGGVGSFEHVTSLVPTGVDGVIIGKAIYEGKVTLKQVSTL